MNESVKWAAENIHQRPCESIDIGTPQYFNGDQKRLRVDFLEDHMWIQPCNEFVAYTDWQAARDELSGKPSWDDVPEWAEWIAQSLQGHWECYADRPIAENFRWEHGVSRGECVEFSKFRGKVLGDWRNTLERRPEQNQLESTKKIWRGPEDGLPPVGADIEVWYDDGRECWMSAIVIGYYPESERVIAVNVNTGGNNWKLIWVNQFRPLRSEEDKAVDEMIDVMTQDQKAVGIRRFAELLYRAGYRKQEAE